MKIGAVLMASGFGTRFGSNKLLAELRGRPLIAWTIDAIPVSLFHRAVICASHPEILALGAKAGYTPLRNLHPEEGISASIRLGLSHMHGMDGVLFCVGDQPYLTPKSVAQLLEYFCENPGCICALGWHGRRGNPVLFPAALFPELSSLSGDTGGRCVIRNNTGLLHIVDAASEKELFDVDIPSDLVDFN